jgi:hypothetical protein
MFVTIARRSSSVSVKTNHLRTYYRCCDLLGAVASRHPGICTASNIVADLLHEQSEPAWGMAVLGVNESAGDLEALGLQPSMILSQLIQMLEEDGWYGTAVGRHEGGATAWEMTR